MKIWDSALPHTPHSLTVLPLKGVDLAHDSTEPMPFEEIKVGHGPCSVVVFDTEKVTLNEVSVDHEMARLGSSAGATS